MEELKAYHNERACPRPDTTAVATLSKRIYLASRRFYFKNGKEIWANIALIKNT
tara:strand:- start:175763 stop:175924 length:162 start_codon:yes stop_codon:yes gene_type:complete